MDRDRAARSHVRGAAVALAGRDGRAPRLGELRHRRRRVPGRPARRPPRRSSLHDRLSRRIHALHGRTGARRRLLDAPRRPCRLRDRVRRRLDRGPGMARGLGSAAAAGACARRHGGDLWARVHGGARVRGPPGRPVRYRRSVPGHRSGGSGRHGCPAPKRPRHQPRADSAAAPRDAPGRAAGRARAGRARALDAPGS